VLLAIVVRPNYLETAMYGRKWVSRLVVSLASIRSIAVSPPESDIAAEAQKVIREQTQKFLSGCIAKESAASEKGHTPDDAKLNEAYRNLVVDFLSGFDKMDTEYLHHFEWLNPTFLSWCTRSNYAPIQKGCHDLLEKTSPASTVPKTDETKAIQETDTDATEPDS
jgi:hypothetical protein